MLRQFLATLVLVSAPFHPLDASTFTTSGLSPATHLQGENGTQTYHLLSAGDSFGGYTVPNTMDGIGAYLLDADTVRLVVNHEKTPAKISYIDVNRNTLAIESASNAISSITGSQTISEIARFCSSGFWESSASAPPGATNVTNFTDSLYLTGEEVTDGYVYALDPATGTLHQAPDVGQAKWENIAVLDTRGTDRVALLLGDDSNDANLYLYIGDKNTNPGASFLERNGLDGGQLYVWKSDTPGETNPATIVGGTTQGNVLEGRFVPAAGASGAFEFERPEDVAPNPFDGSQAVFATTGNNEGDVYGGLWTVDFFGPLKDNAGFTSIGLPTDLAADISLLYDADDNVSSGLVRLDNLDWADDGNLYVQTDGASGVEGIFSLDPDAASPAPLRIAFMSNADGTPTSGGESSGILDVSLLFGQSAGTIFVADVQNAGAQNGHELVLLVTPEPSRALLMAVALFTIAFKRRRSATK